MKRSPDLRAVALSLLLSSIAFTLHAAGDSGMRILTYPTGLVVGELEVKVDLGPEGAPANLLLDGRRQCALTQARPSCTVDLGVDPRVHHLELRRDDGSRAERWINRPGQEAELGLTIGQPDERRVCTARITWAHPLKQDPTELVVTMNGRPLRISDNRHYTRFPCLPGEQPVLVASAVFPDGRRVESAAVVGAFAERTSVELAALPLVAGGGTVIDRGVLEQSTTCQTTVAEWLPSLGTGARHEADSGFEIVLVLDPGASYWNLYTSGWHAGRLPTLPSTAMTGQQIFRKGERMDEPKPKTAWRKAEKTLFNASRLWYVVPDEGLHRVNGFAAGRPDWLKLLFRFGTTEMKEAPRIADAVAASGLVAGAGPKRAVVLILGNDVAERDRSDFSPPQVRQYLAEIGVPLFVLRNGKLRDDGWPKGLANLNMEAMADNLEIVQTLVERQCLAWVEAEKLPEILVEGLPGGIRLAGRDGEAPETPAAAWAAAEIEHARVEALRSESNAMGETAVTESIDVTAVQVLISAIDENGNPIADLAPVDLEPVEDGAAGTVLALSSLALDSPVAPADSDQQARAAAIGADTRQQRLAAADTGQGLPIAIYIDRVIGGGADQRGALRAVQEVAPRLTALGPVEIVTRDLDGVATALEPTRDPERLSETIDEISRHSRPLHAIESIRRDFAKRIQPIPDRITKEQKEAAGGGQVETQPGAGVWFGAASAASEESLLISRAMRQLESWATSRPERRVGLLLVIGLAFDENMASYYQPFVDRQEPHNAATARAALRERSQSAAVGSLGEKLSGTGWRILSVAGTISGSTDYAAENRSIRFQEHMSASSSGALTLQTSDQLLVDSLGTQRHLAEASGGDAVLGARGLGKVIDASRGWYLLTYQVSRSPDGVPHTLELRSSRPGIALRANRVISDRTPEGQAEARVLRLLTASGSEASQSTHGDLLSARLALTPPSRVDDTLSTRAELTIDLMPIVETLAQLGEVPDLMLSIATATNASAPVVVHHREPLDELRAGWMYTFPVQWPVDAGGRIAVVVEEVHSGARGEVVAELPGDS